LFLVIIAPGLMAGTTRAELTLEQRRADLDQLVGLIRSNYGMLEYKKRGASSRTPA